MSLLFIDSFAHHDQETFSKKNYSRTLLNVPMIEQDGRRLDSWSANFGPNGGVGGSASTIRAIGTTGYSGLVCGIAHLQSSYFLGGEQIIGFTEGGPTVTTGIVTNPDGSMDLIVDNVVRASTSINFLNVATWDYFEFKLIRAVSGLAEIRVNQVPVLSWSGDTLSGIGEPTTLTLPRHPGGFSFAKGMDLYLLSTDGSENNDYLGDVRVEAYQPIANGTTNTFIPNIVGENVDAVKERVSDDDTSFVESGTVGDIDYYRFNGITQINIKGVQQLSLSRKNDADTITIDLLNRNIISGSTNVEENRSLGDSYNYGIHIMDTDPEDSSTWTDTKIADTEFGFKLKTKG